MAYQAGTPNPSLTAPSAGTESATFGSAILEADLSGTVNGNTAGSYRWTGSQIVGLSLPVVTTAIAATLSYAVHNNRFLTVTASSTITVPTAATLTSGFKCELVAVGAAVITLSGTLTDFAGNTVTVIPAGRRARILSDGTTNFCQIIGSGVSVGFAKAVAYAATITIDGTAEDYVLGATGTQSAGFTVTGITGALTLANPTGLTEGQAFNVWIPQDSTGSRILSVGANWLQLDAATNVLSTAANAIDVLVCKNMLGKIRYTIRKAS